MKQSSGWKSIGENSVISISNFSFLIFIMISSACLQSTPSSDVQKMESKEVVYIALGSNETVAIIGMSDFNLIGSIPIKGKPEGVAIDPKSGRLYVGAMKGRSIKVVDTVTNEVVGEVHTGMGTHHLSLSPDGRTLYAVAMNDELLIIDTKENQISKRIYTAPTLYDVKVSPDGNTLYTSNKGHDIESPDIVMIIEPKTGDIKNVTVGREPSHMALTHDGSRLFVANAFSSTISDINTSSRTVVREIQVGGDPHGMAVTPDDGYLIVALRGETRVVKIDIESGEVISILDAGPNPANIALSPDGRVLFVNLWGTYQTLVFEAETGRLLKEIEMPDLPHEIAFKVVR
jgi:YVTN family beta-propeller protein